MSSNITPEEIYKEKNKSYGLSLQLYLQVQNSMNLNKTTSKQSSLSL